MQNIQLPVVYEYHDGGGSVWVAVASQDDTSQIAHYQCVWSTAVGNIGEQLQTMPGNAKQLITIPYKWVENHD